MQPRRQARLADVEITAAMASAAEDVLAQYDGHEPNTLICALLRAMEEAQSLPSIASEEGLPRKSNSLQVDCELSDTQVAPLDLQD